MNAPEEAKKNVIPITLGKEIKSRRSPPRATDHTNEKSAMRRLAQCLQMAVELIKEASPHQ